MARTSYHSVNKQHTETIRELQYNSRSETYAIHFRLANMPYNSGWHFGAGYYR